MDLSQETKALQMIISQYNDIWTDSKKARALFMDFFPENKPLCHALLSCIDLSLPAEIKELECCTCTKYNMFVKKLTREYGYLDELAGEAVLTWLNAFDVIIENQSDSEYQYQNDYKFLQGEFVGKYIGISKYNEKIIESIILFRRNV